MYRYTNNPLIIVSNGEIDNDWDGTFHGDVGAAGLVRPDFVSWDPQLNTNLRDPAAQVTERFFDSRVSTYVRYVRTACAWH